MDASLSLRFMAEANSLVEPTTRRAKNDAAHPEPNAYMPIRLPISRPSALLDSKLASAPYKLAVYMLPHRRTQSVPGMMADW